MPLIMFNIDHTESIKTVREWFDDISYSTLNNCLMQFLGQTGELYPDFNKFVGFIDRINPLYAFIFSVFRLGQPTERAYLGSFIPTKVIDALIETGILENKGKYYQMPEIGFLPLNGMYFVTPLPEAYPTVSRGSRFRPVDYSVPLIMDEIISQAVGRDFLELNADFGLLANTAATKGFKNIHILPKHADYVPFIQLNLMLNQHEGEVITRNDSKAYDLITCINLSVKEKIERRNLNISDEKDLIRLFPIFDWIKESGQAILLLESVGTIGEIAVNERLKATNGFNIQSVVLNKIPYSSLLLTNYTQSAWEKQFELVPPEYVEYVKKAIDSPESKAFVFTQLLKISKQKSNEPFVLYPFYNPRYSDPVYNYASLSI